MDFYSQSLEIMVYHILNKNGIKPNLSERDFLNSILVFQYALMDKLFENQEYDNMSLDDRMLMAESCGNELRKLIHTYTGIDTHQAFK
jgi:phenylacetate-coenzyme A ligase PaaK-like adenylate-forming protein